MVVLAKGQLPCDLLFVGEAPGKSDDILGKPFMGPAGKLLDEIIATALSGLFPYRIAFTNIIACIPLEDGEKTSEPNPSDIKSCRPRLLEMIRIAKPSLIILVGKLAKKYTPSQSEIRPTRTRLIRYVEIDHPAYLLRLKHAQQGLAIRRAEVRIRCGVQEEFGNA